MFFKEKLFEFLDLSPDHGGPEKRDLDFGGPKSIESRLKGSLDQCCLMNLFCWKLELFSPELLIVIVFGIIPRNGLMW